MSTDLPVVVDKKPTVMDLEAGTYYWCSCGLSKNQPFCNGAHKGTDFTPLAFELDEKKTIPLCLCKQTGNAPFCDGSHHKLAS
ncbi:MAG: CDGSH iron-sulfur domain-containing protein [Leptolyngbyaceae bacterium]|nr:CDGSH iron-sulfur domain-containing protein [Leptolyngbyaceae bacterium]